MATPQDGKQVETPADSSTTNSEETAAGAEVQPERSQHVDRERFDGVNNRMKTAEAAVQFSQQQLNTQAQQIAALSARVAEQIPDAELEKVKEPYRRGATAEDGTVNEEVMNEAFNSVLETARYGARQEMSGMRKEIISAVTALVDNKVGTVTSTIQTSGAITGAVQNGMLTQAEAAKVSQRMQEAIRAEPSWGTQTYQPTLLSKTIGEMVMRGEIQPRQAAPEPRNPLQGGGNSVAPGAGPEDSSAEMAEIKRKFGSTFSGMSVEDMASLLPPKSGATTQVVGDDGNVHQVEADAMRGSFEHRRSVT